MDAARPFGSSVKTRPIPRAARSRMFRRWRAPCSAKKSATPFGPDNPMRRSSRLSEPKSLEPRTACDAHYEIIVANRGNQPYMSDVRDFACLASAPTGLSQEHAKSGYRVARMVVRIQRICAFQGGQYGNRYREVLQLPKGLRLHSTGGRRR